MQIASGSDSGSWTSLTRTTTSQVTSVYLKIKGDVLSGATVYATGDGGEPSQEITPNSVITLTNQGVNLKIKISLSDTTTRVESLSLMYKYA